MANKNSDSDSGGRNRPCDKVCGKQDGVGISSDNGHAPKGPYSSSIKVLACGGPAIDLFFYYIINMHNKATTILIS